MVRKIWRFFSPLKKHVQYEFPRVNQSSYIISLIPSQIARQCWPNVTSSSLSISAQGCSRRCRPNLILLIDLTLAIFVTMLAQRGANVFLTQWHEAYVGQLHRYMYLVFLPSSSPDDFWYFKKHINSPCDLRKTIFPPWSVTL